jgi:hypothetical protein
MGMHDTMNKHNEQDYNCMDIHNKKHRLFHRVSSGYDELDSMFALKQKKFSADLMYDLVILLSKLLFVTMVL